MVEALAPDGPWCKAAAVNPAVEASSADIVVVNDADCWTPSLVEAVAAVKDGAAWGMPHYKVFRLSEQSTTRLIEGAGWEEFTRNRKGLLSRRAYPAVWGGGIVVARRDVLLEARMDPRFLDWGNEDTSWARALSCLFGDGWRGSAPLLHLWHPPEPRIADDRGSPEGWQLFLRYNKARRDPVAMRALLEEARCLSSA